MARLPIRELLVQRAKPKTTLSLLQAFREDVDSTVESYVFTETIRKYFDTILDTVARGVGQGFWVQAEYGAGKTHFLATLAALLSNADGDIWDRVSDEEIRQQRERFKGVHLFPVLLSLRGESQADSLTARSLLQVLLEKGFATALHDAGLDNKVRLTSADDLVHWFETEAPIGVRKEVEELVHKNTRSTWEAYVRDEGPDAAAEWVQRYCDEHKISPIISAGLKMRLAHIYQQITSVGTPRYTGILLVIDEYESWSGNRPSPQAQSEDGDLLETLARLLFRDLGLQVHTIVASQTDVPAKLLGGQEGDRFVPLPLLAELNSHDYDVIISRRVRGLNKDRVPEINDYHAFYRSSFDFAKGISESEFADVFPFQPRCFDVVRRITSRDLPAARSGILIFHEVINHPELTNRTTLIRVCDLLKSEHLSRDCLTTTVYRDALNAYRLAEEALPTLDLDAEDMPLAKDVLTTLFLWHVAHLELPQPLTAKELAEATLTQDALLKAEDGVLLVLNQLQALPQVKLEGKGAFFEPNGGTGLQVKALFDEQVKKMLGDPYRVRSEWSNSLFWTAQDTRGQSGLLAGFSLDVPTSRRQVFSNLEYLGTVTVSSRWQPDWLLPLPKEDAHFRLVILTPDAADSVKAADLQDGRIAVIYPGELGDDAMQAAAKHLAWREMDKRYRNDSTKEGETVRDWLDSQRTAIISALMSAQLPVYRNGRVVTRGDLAISARDAFNQPSSERRLAFVLEKLLAAAYPQLPVDAAALRSTLTSVEVGKVADGFFSPMPNSTQTAATRNYGVGLGLSSRDQPSKFAPQLGCKAFAVIRAMLEERQGAELPVWHIFGRLAAPPYGLPYVVIQLYVLAFVRNNDPRTDLMLKRGHKLKGRDGRPLARDRLNAAGIVELDWKTGLDRDLESLVAVVGPSWNDALPYAREVVADLRPATEQTQIDAQAERLSSGLGALAEQLADTRDTLGTLERSLASAVPPDDRAQLDRLQKVYEGSGATYVEFYERARSVFPTPDLLRDALRVHTRLTGLARQAAEINEVKAYLSATQLRPEDGGLAADRDSLLAQLSLPSLATQPTLWNAIQDSFDQFKARYRNEYLKFHRDSNAALAKLSEQLAAAPRQLKALSLLNSVRELGPPLGADLARQYEALATQTTPCTVTDYLAVQVDSSPVCAVCGRKLTDPAPVQSAQALFHGLDAALTDQKRRLASEAIRRVLERSKENAVSRFVQVVQTANTASLVDVMDDKLVGLVRELLAEDEVAVVESDLLRQFAQEYPTLEEVDVPKAIARFEELLRQAFSEARRAQRGKKPLRLTLR